MATYTQPDGTETDTYFQDVAISPATVADGTLQQRFNTKRYPKVGVKFASAPTVSSVLPATLIHGGGTTLTILGGDFDDTSVVSVSGTGVTVVSTTNVDNEGQELTAAITSTIGSTVGARNVIVTNGDGGAVTATAALTLLPTVVTVSGASPATIAHSTTGDVTISGTGFRTGAVVTVSGTGVTVNSTTFTNATTLVANLTIDVAAAHTARDVTVTNTDTGTATDAGVLTIT